METQDRPLQDPTEENQMDTITESQEAADVAGEDTPPAVEAPAAPAVIEPPAPVVVQPAPTPPPAPVVPPAPPAPKVVAPAVVKTAEPAKAGDFESRIANLKLTGTSEEKGLIYTFEAYIEGMRPGVPVSGEKGNQFQYTLWRALFNIIHNAPVAQFKTLWQLVLEYFKVYHGSVFDDRYLNRFSEFWKQNRKELDGFQRLLNLIKLTANPATREQGLKQVDLDKTLSAVFSDEGRNRVISFYKR